MDSIKTLLNTKLKQKLLFASSISMMLLGISLTTGYGLHSLSERYYFTSKEISGIHLTKDLFKVVIIMQKIRGLYALQSLAPSIKQKDELELEIKNLRLLQQDPAWLNGKKESLKQLFELDREQLSSMIHHLIENKKFSTQTHIIDQLFTLIQDALDSSNLILDPEAESYYLMHISLQDIPSYIKILAEIRGQVSGKVSIIDGSTNPYSNTEELLAHAHALKVVLDNSLRYLDKLSSINPTYDKLNNDTAKILINAKTKLHNLHQQSLNSDNLNPSQTFHEMTAYINKLYAHQNALLVKFDNYLTNRLYDLKLKILFSITSFIFVVCFYIFITYRYYKNQKESNEALEALSLTDPLTGLSNRRHFDLVSQNEALRAKRDKCGFVVGMLDVDYFKKLNDFYGHDYGDICLKKIAKELKSIFKRPGDHVFRIGGEEFCFLIRSDSEQVALGFAEKVRHNIEQLNITHLKGVVGKVVTVSIGLVYKEFASEDSSIEESSVQNLLKKADTALYQAKENGRNQCVLYPNNVPEKTQKKE